MSLRAKVTGVTVAVLAIGLFATGAGATVFFRNALIANLESTVQQAATAETATGLFDIEVANGVAEVADKSDPPRTDYHVALYAAEPPGALLISGGGEEPAPDFPAKFALEKTLTGGIDTFALEDSKTGAQFRASVAPLEVNGALFSQMVALPTAPINQAIGTFLGIYSILSVIAIISGALLTRWLVTLTFRSLGQVEETAMAIAAGDFSQRLTDIEPMTTEVGRLKAAINAMLGRVDAALNQRDSSVRQMRRFIGDASHELRTPLVTVRGYAELYRMGAISGDDEVAQAMDRIEKEAVRMGVLVEDLLALARLDERRDVIIAPVDLRPIARDAALDVRATSPHRQVTVIDTTLEPPAPRVQWDANSAAESERNARRRAGVPTSAIARVSGGALSLLRRRQRLAPSDEQPSADETAPAEPVTAAPVTEPIQPIVLGDENRIRQVVANLLGNARRFTADDSPIDLRVGVDAEAGLGWIEVADHGEGIPPQIREKIFQRFWRADTSRARETGGTGLGLSIVASIVEALHGTVTVRDTPGGGATFRVGIPLAGERDAQDHLLIETQPLTRFESPPD
ncbi:HAMP domain-containing histidine kinase [Microbacterium sp. zg.B48]|uniref:sensor histidine kinase n=1 Tax=unclassified Microbacterium TaxID=2609290 RepID=UPI00214AEF72|nr:MULTISPECIES: HAMP domain-containing sensor histidine kinase [unclassified Microbacterium]MCR2762520.1 HAMP domain-containing histidine kinase [Microbacterium sp. zg.B48]MCR2810690.1 HAMP domain-containing histidine kinase [Microbacterium sp. zg.B185]WIM18227.1 HAMP domain-containing sensor histidine kinase [Microbacterium sp. zg-B185]